MSKPILIVIGNGMVSAKFCEKFLDLGGLGVFQTLVFGEEPLPAYDRVNLTQYLSGKSREDLILKPSAWYRENGFDLRLGEKIVSINREDKQVVTSSGHAIAYDKLVMATGSKPFVPSIPGIDKAGVFLYRTLQDLDDIKIYAKNKSKATVIGGGLLGLEAAKAVLDLGLETTVIEFAAKLMPRQIDETGSDVLKRKIESLNVQVLLNKNTSAILGNGCITGLAFADESSLDTDLLVVSAGIVPRDKLARDAGLSVGARGGVVVDDCLKTTDPDIYAIGEVALFNQMIYGLVAPGYEMASVVAHQLVEKDMRFTGADMSTKLKLMGVDVGSFGDPFGQDHVRSVTFENKLTGVYKRLNFSTDGATLLGGILVGDTTQYGELLYLVKEKSVITEAPEILLMGDSISKSQSKKELPDTAQICSCENVSKGRLCEAIQENKLADLAGIKKTTRAGTGCGGCIPQLVDLLSKQLAKNGIVTKKVLCEHFKVSRQELFEIIKFNKLKTFMQVLAHSGTGRGCELCKPPISSILASLWNDPILEQAVFQDSNDRFLANIQRDGSYSVVPRVPGGEITPEKLMALGQVAKKYKLYCKITGGQRIDLFGAQVNQLPAIWRELIDAGFESGHAYGKALRTVKSCVGSTWCRYGVQDSVSFAIQIENRYKGIRAPHKLKSAVSGCVRECAEAQCKDFGIIATEKGWNLYVCGNGGAKPQHAVLLATDIDRATCIQYLDRFLIYYIRTASPLTRTATWLNQLEGGLDYLKDVIIQDKLGICQELEREMTFLVDTYQCEWADAIADPEKVKKFTHFVNSSEPDSTLSYVTDRMQKIPARRRMEKC